MALSRRGGGGKAAPGALWSAEDADFVGHYPLLFEMLTETQFADGGARKTSTLLLFVDAGMLKACLSDREESLVAFASAGSFNELLDALEGGLSHDSLDWRPAGGQGKRRK